MLGDFVWPRSGPGDDNAHPPIHPTKLPPAGSLEPDEQRVYELVARHFLACCSKDAVGQLTTVRINIADETFSASGVHLSILVFNTTGL